MGHQQGKKSLPKNLSSPTTYPKSPLPIPSLPSLAFNGERTPAPPCLLAAPAAPRRGSASPPLVAPRRGPASPRRPLPTAGPPRRLRLLPTAPAAMDPPRREAASPRRPRRSPPSAELHHKLASLQAPPRARRAPPRSLEAPAAPCREPTTGRMRRGGEGRNFASPIGCVAKCIRCLRRRLERNLILK